MPMLATHGSCRPRRTCSSSVRLMGIMGVVLSVGFFFFSVRNISLHPGKEPGVMETHLSHSWRLMPFQHQVGGAHYWTNTTLCPACLNLTVCSSLQPFLYLKHNTATDVQQLYQRHKRPMHFEVIALHKKRQNVTDDDATTCDWPELMVYFHIFKNGGTTMRDALRSVATRVYGKPKVLFTGIQSKIGTPEFHRRLNATVQDIWSHQQQQQHQQEVFAFTFVRDPVSRFLSGLGQVLHKHQQGKYAPDFPLASCFVPNISTSHMLDCVLSSMQQAYHDPSINPENAYYDFHLLPQLFLLRDFTAEIPELEITLLDLSTQLSPLLESLLVDVQDHTTLRHHKRPSRHPSYTGGHDLSSSSAKVLTARQVRTICSLYSMDVELLQRTKTTPIYPSC